MHLQEGLTPWESAICGGFAGVVSRIVIAPLDVVKIRLQLQSARPHHPIPSVTSTSHDRYRGVVGTMRYIIREEGFRALWKGNLAAEYMYLVYGAIQFSAYKWCHTVLDAHVGSNHLIISHTMVPMVAGASSGALATAISYPLDLLRTRMASQGKDKIYKGLAHAIKEIIRVEGVGGLYRGLSPSIIQIAPYMGLMFGSYDLLRTVVDTRILPLASPEDPPPSQWVDATCGALAGVVSKTGVFPLDLVRKRLQVQGPSRTLYAVRDIPRYSPHFLPTLIQIGRHEGMRGLYRGLLPSLVKAAPASAATFWAFGVARRCLAFYTRDE